MSSEVNVDHQEELEKEHMKGEDEKESEEQNIDEKETDKDLCGAAMAVEKSENPMVTDTAKVEDHQDSQPNPYDYLKRDEFTSERFKVEIKGMHRQVGFKQLKKKMGTLGLHPHKVKILKWGAFVTFMSAEERDSAIKNMNGVIWKGNKLEVSIAKPRADPGLESVKRKLTEIETEAKNPKQPHTDVEAERLNPIDRLKSVVTPLCHVPYEEQLQTKTSRVRELLCQFYNKVIKENPLLVDKLQTERDEESGRLMICPLKPIMSSSALTYYRNKCEFTIGKDLHGKDRVVGFNYGKHKGGDRSVGSSAELIIVSPSIEKIRLALQNLLDKKFQHLPSYDSMTYTGFWRTATVRCTRAGDTMLAVEVCGSDWENEDVASVTSALKQYFSSEECQSLRLQSLYFILRQRTADQLTDQNCRLLFGNAHIIEECMGLNFQISLSAFFQVNTIGAEVLYSKVRQLCTVGNNVVVLDLCCGTGTIGLCIARSVQKVIGVEMCAEAVEDAKANARRNDIQNVEYVCGKVEDVLPQVLGRINPEKEVVAILDPPRAGMHADVIAMLRKHQRVQSIIYVSCNPAAAGSNFAYLGRQQSNRLRGTPFIPVEATPVDLFPQTRHVELVMLWKRVGDSDGSSNPPENCDSTNSM